MREKKKKILEKNCSFIASNIQVECQQNLKICLDEMTHFHRNDNKRNDDSIEGIYGESINKNWTIFFTSSQSFRISIEREKKERRCDTENLINSVYHPINVSTVVPRHPKEQNDKLKMKMK